MPFFIVGNPRSGTTLLRFILSSHSRIYIPEETGFLPHLVDRVDAVLSPHEVEALVAQIGDMNAEWADLVDDSAAFFEQLPQPTLTHVLDAMYHLRIAPHGAVRWGDKGPSYVRWIDELEQIFPNALYVNMIRDGRDSSLSALKKWGRNYRHFDMYYLMTNWGRNIDAGQSATASLGPGRFLNVRYEELVTETESTVKRICEFLGESFEIAMLDHTGLAKKLVAPTGHFEVEQPVNQRTVANWRKQMTLSDQKLANRIAGSTLNSLGYEVPSLPAMTAGELIRYAALAGKFAVTDTLRRTLYAAGWLKMNREKSRRR